MGGSSSKLARRRSSSGSAAPPSPAKKKRDSKKALATPTKDLLRMLSTDPAAARRASRDVRAARFAADFDRDFDADEPAAGGPSSVFRFMGQSAADRLADGLAELLRLRAFDSAADAFARLVRSNNDRAAATFAVLVNRLERSMTKRENVASDTALLRMLRTMHHRSGKTLVAVMRKSKPLVASLLNLLVHIGARLVHKRFNRLVAVRSAKGTGFPLFSENPMNEGWWKNMNGTADATAKVNVFMQEVDDVDDYMDEDEEGGGATSPPPGPPSPSPGRRASPAQSPSPGRRASSMLLAAAAASTATAAADATEAPAPAPAAVLAAAVAAAKFRERGRSGAALGAPSTAKHMRRRASIAAVTEAAKTSSLATIAIANKFKSQLANQFKYQRPPVVVRKLTAALSPPPEEVRVMLAHRDKLFPYPADFEAERDSVLHVDQRLRIRLKCGAKPAKPGKDDHHAKGKDHHGKAHPMEGNEHLEEGEGVWLCFEGNRWWIPERLGSVLLRECDLTLLVRLWWHVPSGKIKVAVLENHLPTAVHWNLDAEFLCSGPLPAYWRDEMPAWYLRRWLLRNYGPSTPWEFDLNQAEELEAEEEEAAVKLQAAARGHNARAKKYSA